MSYTCMIKPHLPKFYFQTRGLTKSIGERVKPTRAGAAPHEVFQEADLTSSNINLSIIIDENEFTLAFKNGYSMHFLH